MIKKLIIYKFLALSLLFLSSRIIASEVYVSQSNTSGVEDGSMLNPYSTIQAAADAAQKGDIVSVMAGVYREEVLVATDGLVFQPHGSDQVTIKGTEKLTSWTSVGNNVYRATMNWDCIPAEGGNQLFVDEKMIFETRWPDQLSNDLVMPTDAIADNVTATGGNIVVITDSDFDQPDGLWNGARIWVNLSQRGHDGWGRTATVVSTNLASHTITVDLGFSPFPSNKPWGLGVGTEYYLFAPTSSAVSAVGGITNVLSPGEWWKNGTDVYVRLTNDGVPADAAGVSNIVEAKKRQFAFVLGDAKFNRNNITINNFSLFACAITTDYYFNSRVKETAEDSYNNTINGIKAKYVMHFNNCEGDWTDQWSGRSGIIISGVGNTLKNSTIEYSAGPGVCLVGYGNKLLNSIITSTNYSNTNSGAVNTGQWSFDSEIGYNTITNTPMMAIAFKGFKNADVNKKGVARIHHNKVVNFLRRGYDSGAIDEVSTDGQWVRIDHNEIYNTLPDAIDGEGRFGLYFDFGGINKGDYGRYIIDHNVIYNVNVTMQTNSLKRLIIFNNVLFNENPDCTMSNGASNYKDDEPWHTGYGIEDTIENNIMSGLPNIWDTDAPGMSKAYIKNNVFYKTSKSYNLSIIEGNSAYNTLEEVEDLFEDAGNYNFLLKSSASDAIDKGIDYSPYNGAIINEVDLGAYEYGVAPWKTGNPILLKPIVTPNGGAYFDSVIISLSVDTPGVAIYYTLNGLEPDKNATLYSTPFVLKDSALVKAIAYTLSGDSSEVTLANFHITKYTDPYLDPITVSNPLPGLNAEYFPYSGDLNITRLPDLETYTPVRVDVVPKVQMVTPNSGDFFMVKYTGFIEIPTDGVYTFYTNSDDGSKLYIGNRLVVNNDFIHASTEKSGYIGLKAGYHRITIDYMESTSSQSISASYKGPDITKQLIPEEILWRNTFVAKPAKVSFIPDGNKFVDNIEVELLCSTTGSTIHYTTDGSNPTTGSPVYSGKFLLSETTLVKAIAYKDGLGTSILDSALFEKSVAPVLISPMAGKYPVPLYITLTTQTPDAEIYYTTNGEEPTTGSILYTDAFILDAAGTVKAFAVKEGMPDSPVTSLAYTLMADTVDVLPNVNCFPDSLSVRLECSTPGAIIRYTIGSATPGVSSPIYSQPIVLKATSIIKAIAYKTGIEPSVIVTRRYEKRAGCVVVSQPTISLDEEVEIYPNPSENGEINIRFRNVSENNLIIQIHTTTGSLILNKDIQIDSNNLDYTTESNLPKGLYLITIRGKRLFKQEKMIVK